MARAFSDLGYSVGNQRKAELLADKYYFDNNFDPVIEYCNSAQVFQDIPFSWPETWKHLDQAFPGSKFILTLRDDAEQWYQSVTRFHGKLFGQNGNTPTADDLRNADYVRKGFMYNTVKVHGTPEHDPYNKEIMIAHYERYNRDVIAYFSNRPDDLLIINVAEPGAYQHFVSFLGVQSSATDFPWENRT
ncbi:MAG TPA: hypothetical protein DF427_12720 [Moraxellaceae bacterium]|nr:hypothetical protein [Moraxellaceae bacterium]